MGAPKIEFYTRSDGKFAWRLKAGNGEIIATDGGQGYENRADATAAAELATDFTARGIEPRFDTEF